MNNNLISIDNYRKRKITYYPVLENNLERLERLVNEARERSKTLLREAIETRTKIAEILALEKKDRKVWKWNEKLRRRYWKIQKKGIIQKHFKRGINPLLTFYCYF